MFGLVAILLSIFFISSCNENVTHDKVVISTEEIPLDSVIYFREPFDSNMTTSNSKNVEYNLERNPRKKPHF